MKRFALTSFALAVLLVPAPWSQADLPDTFENLEVLPKEMGKRELVQVMQGFTGALGVSCTYCHVERTPGDHNSIDWATDELDTKKVTRQMMRMVGTINKDLLPGGGEADSHRVSCITCHRGVQEPETLDHLLVEVVEDEGVEAALEKYRALREKYHGSGSYDFRAQSLSAAAQTLAQKKKDLDGAIKLLNLNLEVNPGDADSYAMLGQLQASKGDQDAALANVRKALEINPGHWQAQKMLKQLSKGE